MELAELHRTIHLRSPGLNSLSLRRYQTARTLHAYTDSGHNQYGDGKAHGGFGVYLGGGPIDFLSQKHEIVTDSTLYRLACIVNMSRCGRPDVVWNS